MENWRNFVRNRLLLGGHAIVNSITAVKLTVSYQTRVRPCLFLLIFQILLLFTRLLFLPIAFSLPILSLLPFFSFWFFYFFSLRRSSYFYFIFHPPCLIVLRFNFIFPPLLSHLFSCLCPILLFILLFHLLFCLLFFFSTFLRLRTFFSSWHGTERLAVTRAKKKKRRMPYPS